MQSESTFAALMLETLHTIANINMYIHCIVVSIRIKRFIIVVKEFIVDVWESRKLRLYGENACPGPQPNSSGWDLGQDGKLWNGRNGRSGKLSHSSDVIGACICSNDVNVCGSAHCGCVVNGSVAMAAF